MKATVWVFFTDQKWKSGDCSKSPSVIECGKFALFFMLSLGTLGHIGVAAVCQRKYQGHANYYITFMICRI